MATELSVLGLHKSSFNDLSFSQIESNGDCGDVTCEHIFCSNELIEIVIGFCLKLVYE